MWSVMMSSDGSTTALKNSEKPNSRPQFPKGTPLSVVEAAVMKLPLIGLTIHPGSIYRDKGYRMVSVTCLFCKKTKKLSVDSLLAGKTRGCSCRPRKYGGDPRAHILGQRYDCIVQRCERDSHKQSKDYKGRGIKNKFKSRKHFVKWALAKWPDTDFKGLEFDRIDNDGHYEPANLRLVTSTENHENRPSAIRVPWKGQLWLLRHFPSPYSRNRTQVLAARGLTGEEIIASAKDAVKNKRKKWKVIEQRLKTYNLI
jgi:hypothetical protein